jgi:sec-independent protein translocase protein TatB
VFDLDPAKLLVLGFLALIVLGPSRLPQAARTVGRIIGQLRSMSESFHAEVKDALGDSGETITSAVTELRKADIRRSIRDTVGTTFALPSNLNGKSGSANGTSTPDLDFNAAGVHRPARAPDDPSLN